MNKELKNKIKREFVEKDVRSKVQELCKNANINIKTTIKDQW